MEHLIPLKTGGEEEVPEFDLSEFEGKDFKVQTVRAINCHLCGYELPFRNELVKVGGTKEKRGIKYIMKAENYPALDAKGRPVKGGQSVLPEIMLKLLRPPRTINIIETMPIKAEKPDKPEK